MKPISDRFVADLESYAAEQKVPKEGRALRTETTLNDTYDFGVGRALKNLPALFQVLVLFCLQPEGFRHQHLREHYAQLLGLDPTALTAGQLTHQLRRLRLDR